MPVEFSVAAYRLGHSMIRNAYQWNRVFSSDGPARDVAPGLNLFFVFSRVSGDLGGVADACRVTGSRTGGGCTTSASSPAAPATRSSTSRGRSTRSWRTACTMPAGVRQRRAGASEVARRAQPAPRPARRPADRPGRGRRSSAPPALTPAEVASGPHSAVVTGARLRHEDAAVVLHPEGGRGEAGRAAARARWAAGSWPRRSTASSREATTRSSKQASWKPTLPAKNPDQFTMNDLLLFVDDVNPLGD